MNYQTKIWTWGILYAVLILLFLGSLVLRLPSSSDSWYAHHWGWFSGGFFVIFVGFYIYRTLTREY